MGIRIDQTLHGYAEGHTLLQRSVRLSKESERLMLALSDMSGSGMRPGFESYLTAYPLPSDAKYVLARTWYASEMQRPGCVWTHSLLVRNDDLNKIVHINPLNGLFHRPSGKNPVQGYDDSLAVAETDFAGQSRPDLPPVDLPLSRATLWSLYMQPDKPVYLLGRTALEHESLVLALWSQQWPKLRISFSFCTGALGVRALNGKPFDVQVVPREAITALRHDIGEGTVIESDAAVLIDSGSPEWLSAALQDIISYSDHRLRTTAWTIGEAGGNRETFPTVFHFASVVERRRVESLTPSEYVQAIASRPPYATCPASMLNMVLGAPDLKGLRVGIPECDLLKALATGGLSRLNTVDLEITARAERLFIRDRQAALELFFDLITHGTMTEIGNQILFGICHALGPDDLKSIAQVRPSILSLVIRQKPQLAASSALWFIHPNEQAEILHALMTAEIDSPTLTDIAGSFLRSGSEVVLEHAFQYGERLIAPVLDWLNLNSSETFQISRGWSRYFRHHTDCVVEWLKTHPADPAVIALLAISVPADDSAVNRLDLRKWLPLLDQLTLLSEHDAIGVSAFLLALGLRHCDELAMELIKHSFECVHEAAARSKLEYEHWRPIENVAPAIAFWREWDKCERMRVAILDRFIACEWQPSELLKSIKATRTLEQVLISSNTDRERKKFMKRVVKAGLMTPLSGEFRRLLDKYR